MHARARSTVIAASVVALVALAGCTAGTPDADPTQTESPMVPDDPSIDALAVVTPEQVDSAVEDIPDAVHDAMELTGVPGVAVGVVYDGEVIYAEGFGVRDVETGDAVDADTVFAMASVSKSIGATVIARAIDEGLVTWDTPVAQNLEGFTLSDPYAGANVTIADMYAHRSGLYGHAGDELEDVGYDRTEILQRLRYIPLDPFRAAYAYGNFDITAAGESVARAADEDWADLSERLLYEPLGMASTSSRFADLETRDDRAMGHMLEDGEWIVTPEQRQPDAQSPAGGVSSSVTDMTTWMTMLLAAGSHGGDVFIEPSSLLPAMSPQIITGPPTQFGARAGAYGYGFNVSTSVGGLVDVNHSGAFALGTGTIVKMLPAEGLGIVAMANGSANGVVEGIASRFMDIAQFGEERRDWVAFWNMVFAPMLAPFGSLVGQEPPADAAPAGDLASYAGEYANDYFGPARVSVEGDGLVLRLGPTGEWPLEHWAGDEFVFRPSSENATPGSISKATFSGSTLVLEYFDQHQLGTFTR